MPRFYEPNLGADPDSPFARDASNKLVRRSYWLDMNDRTLVMVMVNGIGAHLTNNEKRAYPTDLKRDHLIDQYVFKKFCRPKSDSRYTVSVIFRLRNRENGPQSVSSGPDTLSRNSLAQAVAAIRFCETSVRVTVPGKARPIEIVRARLPNASLDC